jgi:hypothetical protein
MKPYLALVIALLCVASGVPAEEGSPKSAAARPAPRLYGESPSKIGEYLARIAKAYPDFVDRFDANFLYLRNGRALPISDGRTNKTFAELLSEPDLDDMFYAEYPAGASPVAPPVDFDPGRVRYAPFFKAMYGDCARGQVRKRLRKIAWLPRRSGSTIEVTRTNGVDKALELVSAELDKLPRDLIVYAMPTAGTYNCRSIPGTSNVSMHSYGAAIDLNVAHSAYWLWDKNRQRRTWRNQMLLQIIRIFERYGFIWGGRWYHYDTMHFEYRPELLE